MILAGAAVQADKEREDTVASTLEYTEESVQWAPAAERAMPNVYMTNFTVNFRY